MRVRARAIEIEGIYRVLQKSLSYVAWFRLLGQWRDHATLGQTFLDNSVRSRSVVGYVSTTHAQKQFTPSRMAAGFTKLQVSQYIWKLPGLMKLQAPQKGRFWDHCWSDISFSHADLMAWRSHNFWVQKKLNGKHEWPPFTLYLHNNYQ